MVPVHNLVIDIIDVDELLSEKEFREVVAPSIACLESLKGSFDKRPCGVTFYAPKVRNELSKGWSVRCVLMISVGKERGKHLMNLYDSMVRLIAFELPDFDIQAESAVLNFS